METLRKDSPAMAVYDYIYGEIIHRRLSPGQELTENYLCEKMGLGRSPVRLALQQLAKDGIIDLRANRSAIVTQFTQKQLRQLYSLRENFLEYALKQTIGQYEETDLAVLEECLDVMEKAFEEQDFSSYIQAVATFYRSIINKAGNPYLTESADVLINRINVYLCLYDEFYSVKRLRSLAMHSRMIRGIREGRLAAVLRAHRRLSDEMVDAYDHVVQLNLQENG